MKRSRIRSKKSLQNRCNNPSPRPDGLLQLEREASRPLSSGDELMTRQMCAPDVCPLNREPGYLERELLARGMRLTQQRRTVLGVIEGAPQCSHVGVIHRRARRINTQIHRVTVYRTLELLKRHGIISEEGIVPDCAKQNSCSNPTECDRIRMKCLDCGKLTEFRSCTFGDLTKCVGRDCQFRVATAILDIGGYCQTCRT
jgi:Fur family transcriptional regulator, ferric uptake regulator